MVHTVLSFALVDFCLSKLALLYHTRTMQVLAFTGQLLTKAQELQQQADQILELQRVFK